MNADNPWQVESIEAFCFLKCPECTYYTKEDNDFYNHAVKNHTLSSVFFGKPAKENIEHTAISKLRKNFEAAENSFEEFEDNENSFENNEDSFENNENSFENNEKTIAEHFHKQNNEKNQSVFTSRERTESHGTDEKIQQSIQSPVKTVSKQIPNLESNEMKTEGKEEPFEDFETNEQYGIDYITSKDFDHLSIKTEVKSEVKKEIKTEVKTESFEDFEMREQALIDFITSKDY